MLVPSPPPPDIPSKLGEDMEPIPGLYAAGNVQGNRFAVIYPEVLQGHSIAMALVLCVLTYLQAGPLSFMLP